MTDMLSFETNISEFAQLRCIAVYNSIILHTHIYLDRTRQDMYKIITGRATV